MRLLPLAFLIALALPASAQTEEHITFDSADGIVLAGTVSIPDGVGPFPAVVIASGSGGQDRDGGPGAGMLPDSLMMYRRLAHALTEQGIVVLRYDDRGMGESTLGDRDPQSMTSLDFVDDIVAGAEALAARSDVRWVGVVGHSEGGILAPIAAERSDAIDGLVLLAATAERGYETIIDQNRTIGLAPLGLTEAEMNAVLGPLREMFELVTANPEADLTEAEMARARELFIASNSAIPDEKAAALGITPEVIETMADGAVPGLTARPFRVLLSLDPATYIASVEVPTLGLFFELDQQVPPSRNADPMRTALGASASPMWQTTILSGINHVMQAAETGEVSEYARLGADIDPRVPASIAHWVLATAGE